jgi:hypothetical protein
MESSESFDNPVNQGPDARALTPAGSLHRMQVSEDVLELDWEGPLSTVGNLPTAPLYGVELVFTCDDGDGTLAAVRGALEPVFGPASERKPFLGKPRLEWTGKTAAEAIVKRGRVLVHFGNRVKGSRVAEIVGHLAEVPGARDLRMKAAVRRFLPRPESAPQG